MISKIEHLLLKKYFPRESEEFFQARVLVLIHITLATMMVVVLAITPATGIILIMLGFIFLLSLSSIFFIGVGYLPAVTLITYSGMGLLATLAVFSKPYYQNFEVYALTSFHMFITVVASLLTRHRFYTYFTSLSGVFYIFLLLIFRGLRMASPTHPLEIDDYVIGPAFLLLSGYIIRNTLSRRKHLLDIAENESQRSHEQAKALTKSLEEKEILLHEVHHRVKNNLNVAISLLNMQIRNLDKSDIARITLQDSIGRLNSMALVHERLYAGKNLKAINLRPYITAILHAVMRSLGKTNIAFAINVVDNIEIELAKAVPCGLILNELITNVYKHAYPEGKSGQAEVYLSFSDDNQITLIVQDHGVGMTETDYLEGKSLGMHLVHLLTEQLMGDLQIDHPGGTKISISFPLFDSEESS